MTRARRASPALAALALLLAPRAAAAQEFTYDPPGQLVPGSGEGRVDFVVYAPGIRFPIQDAPAYANSQVWGVGGSQGPGGSQCDAPNFSYPWHDNYCETRTWDMPLCPSGQGHQGQDLRAASCDAGVHAAVAVTDGTITSIGSYSVYLTAPDGTRFDYLHMDGVAVSVGDEVKRGDLLGYVSNSFGGTPTTVHLHFNIRQNVQGFGSVYVPPYLSLVEAYQSLLGPVLPAGTLDAAGCEGGAVGWAWDPADPGAATRARLAFDGAAGSPGVTVRSFAADRARDDLCAPLGSCDHGFVVPLPFSLFDGAPHEVRAYGELAGGLDVEELQQSPAPFTCQAPPLAGVRRRVDAAALAGWGFDPFWDVAPASAEAVEALDEGEPLEAAPSLRESGGELLLVDRGRARALTADAARAFHLDPASATPATPAELASDGPAVRPRPLLVRRADGTLWLVDDPLPAAPGDPGGGGAPAAGCGCGVAGGRGGAWALALLAAALRLRSRRGGSPAGRRPLL